MLPDKLVHMANQIATFFKSQPGGDQAERVAAHLSDFWDPRMISALRAHAAKGGAGLDALVIAALAHMAEAAPEQG
ncbi:formate dehydrogenase subunit delta [Pararhodobacter sp.]|uniref:formate dehydrogenase subunit delta n=1 Tax=Pararhodobacter sp. TaxID=2127056 RepID=UPI002FDDB2AD